METQAMAEIRMALSELGFRAQGVISPGDTATMIHVGGLRDKLERALDELESTRTRIAELEGQPKVVKTKVGSRKTVHKCSKCHYSF